VTFQNCLDKGYICHLQRCTHSTKIDSDVVTLNSYISSRGDVVTERAVVEVNSSLVNTFHNKMIPATELYNAATGKKPSITGRWSVFSTLHLIFVHRQYPCMSIQVPLYQIEERVAAGTLRDWMPQLINNFQLVDQYVDASLARFEAQGQQSCLSSPTGYDVGIPDDVAVQYGLDRCSSSECEEEVLDSGVAVSSSNEGIVSCINQGSVSTVISKETLEKWGEDLLRDLELDVEGLTNPDEQYNPLLEDLLQEDLKINVEDYLPPQTSSVQLEEIACLASDRLYSTEAFSSSLQNSLDSFLSCIT